MHVVDVFKLSIVHGPNEAIMARPHVFSSQLHRRCNYTRNAVKIMNNLPYQEYQWAEPADPRTGIEPKSGFCPGARRRRS